MKLSRISPRPSSCETDAQDALCYLGIVRIETAGQGDQPLGTTHATPDGFCVSTGREAGATGTRTILKVWLATSVPFLAAEFVQERGSDPDAVDKAPELKILVRRVVGLVGIGVGNDEDRLFRYLGEDVVRQAAGDRFDLSASKTAVAELSSALEDFYAGVEAGKIAPKIANQVI
jgi:hypothetical protein